MRIALPSQTVALLAGSYSYYDLGNPWREQLFSCAAHDWLLFLALVPKKLFEQVGCPGRLLVHLALPDRSLKRGFIRDWD